MSSNRVWEEGAFDNSVSAVRFVRWLSLALLMGGLGLHAGAAVAVAANSAPVAGNAQAVSLGVQEAQPVPVAVQLHGFGADIAAHGVDVKDGQAAVGGITTAACDTVLYQNTTTSSNWFKPGASIELIDFGTTPGGRVCRVNFGYATTLSNPGNITIALYSNTSSSQCPGTFITGWAFSGLSGSTSGNPEAFLYYYDIPEESRFNLASGAFGYSYEFANADTGVFLASGGAGQQNEFWVDCGLTWLGGSPWAGAYFGLLSEGSAGTHCYSPPSYDLEIVPTSAWQTTGLVSFQNGECRLYRIYMETSKAYDFSLCSTDGVGGSFAGDGDGDLTLLTAGGSEVWYIDGDYNCGWNASTVGTSYAQYVPSANGYYYLKVDDYYNYAATYNLAYRGTYATAHIRVEPTSLQFDCSAVQAAEPEAPAPAPAAIDPLAAASAPVDKLLDGPEITGAFAAGQERVEVIVMVKPPARPGPTDFDDPKSVRALQEAIGQRTAAVRARVPGADLKERHVYRNIPGFSASLTQAGLQKLLQDPDVVSVEPVRMLHAHLQQGLALMNAIASRSAYNGQGMSIAICDTGIDYTHSRLGAGGFPNAKVIGGYDFGDDDADPMDCQGHGTSCAGIAAGDLGSSGDYIGGVAPAARLYALKISGACTGSAGSAAMIAAWDWCVTHKNDDPVHPILVISTSFGGGRYFSSCDGASPGMTAAAQAAVAAGITLTVSSGNDGYCDSMGWPACISHVISVGAVYDASLGSVGFCVAPESCAPKSANAGCSTGYAAFQTATADLVTSYSNSASFLGVFAPSNHAYTTAVGGGYTPSFGGTSAACPYTAGAVACLQQAAKAAGGSYLTPANVRSVLDSSGDLVTDTKVAITKPRVNLGQAIDAVAPCGQGMLTIYNDGMQNLEVTSITMPSWLTLVSSPPYVIYPNSSLQVCIEVDCDACTGAALVGNVVVYSNDPSNPSVAVPATVQCGCEHPASMDDDCDVDMDDLDLFIPCAAGPEVPYAPVLPSGCLLTLDGSNRIKADIDGDGDVDVVDFARLQRCWSGPGNLPDPGCED